MLRKDTKNRVLAMTICAAMATSVMAGATVVFAEETGIQRETINVGIEADPADLSPFGPGTTGRTAVLDSGYSC